MSIDKVIPQLDFLLARLLSCEENIKCFTMSTHSSTAPNALKIPLKSASDTSDPMLATNRRFSGGVGKSGTANE